MIKNKVLAVIPAKGTSNRLSCKNLQLFGGRTLVENTIDQACFAKNIDAVVLDSDSDEILNIGSVYNIHLHKRTITDDVDILDIVADVCRHYPTYNIIVILQVDNPFRGYDLVDKCVTCFIQGADTNVADGSQPFQDVITVHGGKRTGTVRVIARDALLGNLPTGHIGIIHDDPNYVDIHTQEDLDKANELIPTCPGCSHYDTFRFNNELWKCSQCCLVFQYPQHMFDYSTYSGTRDTGREKRICQYHHDIEKIMQYKTKGMFLDVGCGSGTFLKTLPNSFQKDGIDVRGPYQVGYFPDHKFNTTYDIVHMRATLEHVPDPVDFIKKAYAILKPGGLLAVTHLPNIDNYPKMKGLIKKDEHLLYFNPYSIEYLLTGHGFKILDITFPFYGTPYQHDDGAAFMNVLSVYAVKNED